MPCKPNSHPANLIRHAYSRYEYVCANILALTCFSANTIGQSRGNWSRPIG
jgi:hypothetical protein